jgi:hypothetical protein
MRGRVLGSATTGHWPLGLLRLSEALWRALRLLCIVLGAALLCECGDDDWKGDAGSPRDAGVSASGGAAAVGGRSGSRAVPRGGAGSSFPPMLPMSDQAAIACGTALCVSPTAGFGFITACCADPGKSICGIMSLSGSCMKPDPGDPRCPALNFRGIVSLPSCCNSANQCGLDPSRVGMPGCLDLAEAAEQTRAWGISDEEIPKPRACDTGASSHPEPEPEPDAGAQDAGL